MNKEAGVSNEEWETTFAKWTTKALPTVAMSLRRYTRNNSDQSEIEDAVSEVILRLYETGQEKGIDSYEQFISYLIVATRWKMLDFYRKGSLIANRPNDEFSNASSSSEPDPEISLEIREQIDKVLRSISPKNRKIFELTVEGFKAEEISKKLDITAATVRSIQRRIRHRLNVALGT